ncbi:Golgi reassembly-stacking protein 2-like isoform X1 [Entelurus aequoreus]|uniref:Golgi reassembly-stacking protein 2-like isoform X1 n=1 Tax=Entelurus aequoreus TaxID=161455 RepID=UPI002B1DC24E|nr:Golgi reassembly-stacking protein 2-like isoform X1 [Entelurus aequoreus]
MGGSASIQVPGGGTGGYHVLKVQKNSPAYHAGLEPFFDFILSVGDTRLNKDSNTLTELLERNAERPIQMLLYSIRTSAVRETALVPSKVWGGSGLLGITIRFSSFQGARENVWHVLEVAPNSPAAIAGLQAYDDYIIGADTFLEQSEDLFILIDASEGRQLALHVYNTNSGDCREVLITPNGNWGGAGSLGCRMGYGYLHRVPDSSSSGQVGLTAVLPTLPLSAGLEQSGPACASSDLISIKTDAAVHVDPPTSSQGVGPPSVHPAATQGLLPASASTLPSRHHFLTTSLTIDETVPSSAVQTKDLGSNGVVDDQR